MGAVGPNGPALCREKWRILKIATWQALIERISKAFGRGKSHSEKLTRDISLRLSF
jgi:hypothetical protein